MAPAVEAAISRARRHAEAVGGARLKRPHEHHRLVATGRAGQADERSAKRAADRDRGPVQHEWAADRHRRTVRDAATIAVAYRHEWAADRHRRTVRAAATIAVAYRPPLQLGEWPAPSWKISALAYTTTCGTAAAAIAVQRSTVVVSCRVSPRASACVPSRARRQPM